MTTFGGARNQYELTPIAQYFGMPVGDTQWMRDVPALKTTPPTFGTSTKSFVFAIPTIENVETANTHVHVRLVPGEMERLSEFVNGNSKVIFVTESANLSYSSEISSGFIVIKRDSVQIYRISCAASSIGPWKTMQLIYSVLKLMMIQKMIFPQQYVTKRNHILFTCAEDDGLLDYYCLHPTT